MTKPEREILLWDDSVHESQEEEHLFFWRLAFWPAYPRERIFEQLRVVYSLAGITSYIAYETFGEFDLLLRLWIPRTRAAEEIEFLLRQNLSSCGLVNVNYLSCRTTQHWARDPRFASADDMAAPPDVSDAAVRAVNDFNDRQAQGKPVPRPVEAKQLLEDGVLVAIPLETPGVRFYVVFDHLRTNATLEQRSFALQLIQKKCDEIRTKWLLLSDRRSDPQISIYSGFGSMTDFLVLARSPHPHFHRFTHDIARGLREIDLDSLFRIRPYTNILADQMFSEFREHRTVQDAAEGTQEPVTGHAFAFANLPEDESLEFKATFGLNWRTYMATGLKANEESRVGAVVRAVCGLLNSPHRGTLMIGVLEVQRELERVKGRDDYLAKLVKEFGYDPTPTPSGRLPNAVVGIEVEFDPAGPATDHDTYVQRVSEILRRRIEPNPWPYLRIALRKVGDRTVCEITVRPGAVWFYGRPENEGDPQFFVREASSTRAYMGADMDLYKLANPRPPASAAQTREERDDEHVDDAQTREERDDEHVDDAQTREERDDEHVDDN